MTINTEIVAIVDASGSMYTLLADAIGGLNAFIDSQRQDKDTDKFSLVFFNSEVDVIYDGVLLKDVPAVTNKQYRPAGMTALYDAVGSTIDKVGKRLDALDESEKPDKVLLVILTDGEENASVEYTSDRVKAMLTHQQDVYSWGVIYLAASEGGLKDGRSMGVKDADTVKFQPTCKGVKIGYDIMTNTSRLYKNA